MCARICRDTLSQTITSTQQKKSNKKVVGESGAGGSGGGLANSIKFRQTAGSCLVVVIKTRKGEQERRTDTVWSVMQHR